MEKIARRDRWAWRVAFALLAAVVMIALGPVGSAQATAAHITDPYGRSVRVPSRVITKLVAKHNLQLAALATWLPRSKLAEANGTRKEYRIRLVRVRCARLPILGRVCWRTGAGVTLLSVVDYRTNRQGLQQGLITAYCLGMDRCPDWVNRPRVRSSGGGAGGGGGGGW